MPSSAKIVDKPPGSALLTQHSRFNNSALESFLYGKNVVLAIDMEKIRQKKSLDNPVNESKNHEKSGKSQGKITLTVPSTFFRSRVMQCFFGFVLDFNTTQLINWLTSRRIPKVLPAYPFSLCI